MPTAHPSERHRRATPVAVLALSIGAAVGWLADPGQAQQRRAEQIVEEVQQQIEEQVEEQVDEQMDEADRQREAIEEALEEVGRELRRERHRRRRGSDTKVSIGSTVRVEEDQVAEEAVAIGGSVKIDGEVLGNAVAILGSVKVNGRVSGDVVAVMGGVELGSEAEVLGDVTSVGGRVDREPGATIEGAVTEVAFAPDLEIGDWWEIEPDWGLDRYDLAFFDFMGFLVSLTWVIAVVLLASLLLLMAPKAVSRVESQAVSEPWKSGLIGLAVEILFVPVLVIVVILLAVSIIGIPILILLLLALPFLIIGVLLLGYSGSALAVGHAVDRRFSLKQVSPFLLLLLGIAVLQFFPLFGDLLEMAGGFLWFFAIMFALFGFLLNFAAATVGIGAAFLTRMGTVGPDTAPAMALPPLPEAGEAEVAESGAGELPSGGADEGERSQ